MAPVRFEIWTRPDTGTFTRKFPLIDVVGYSLKLGMFGSGKLVIPRDLARLDDILFIDPANHANDVGSMIRAYVGENHLYDFYASRMQIEYGDLGKRTATITGGSYGSALERTRLRQFDWDADPSVEPDWAFGVGVEQADNGSFELSGPYDPPLPGGGGGFDIAAGFEDENLSGWDSIPASFLYTVNTVEPTVDNGDARTGSFSLVWTAATSELSGIQKTVRIAGSERYQFTVYLKATAGSRFIFGANHVVTTHHTNGWIDNGIGWCELANAAEDAGSTDGTWQAMNLDVTFDVFTNYASITLYVVYEDTGAPPASRIDDYTGAGYNLGLFPWEPTSFTQTTTFEQDTSPPTAALDGSATAKVVTSAANHGYGQRQFVTSGKTQTFTGNIHHDTGSAQDFTIRIVRTAGGTVIAATTLSVPNAGTWTELAVTGVVDVDDVFIQILKVTAGTWWNDLLNFYDGQAASTVGEIVGQIYDDAATDHSGDNRTALAWVTENYTDTQDADSVNWDADISIRLKRGTSYRKIIEQLVRYGYEFDMRPDPADDTVIELSAYNPDGLGTDQTTGDDLAIIDGFVSVGPLIKREPAATYVMVEGDSLQWADSRDTILETPWGEIEYYTGSKDNLITSLTVQAVEQLATIGLQELRVTFQAPTRIPGVDYQIGDIVRVTPGVIPTDTYRVMGITVKDKDPEPLWQVSFEAR